MSASRVFESVEGSVSLSGLCLLAGGGIFVHQSNTGLKHNKNKKYWAYS